jgi:membrane-bound lytic murein transglycosylase D
MILANFNRSLGYLSLLSVLTITGCSQQSTSHLALNEAPDNNQAIPSAQPTANEVDLKVQFGTKPIAETEIVAAKAVAPGTAELTRENFIVKKRSATLRTTATNNEERQAKVIKTTATATAITAVARATNSLWGRMFSMYALPEQDNPRIEEEIENFLKHPKSLAVLQQRAEPYLYLILDELKANKLPGELALLPMIESAFKPDARSHAEAAGLWQFTPATGLSFGLKQNWWYDGRLDVYASTQAATRYLKQLNHLFNGDWLLALASYNVGLGNVQKAIKKNQEQALDTDFWSLDLPKETRIYVPKLLAIAKLLAHADQYNLPLQHIANKPFFKAISINSALDLTKAAELAGMPLDEFFNLNPAFTHAITAPEGSCHVLVKAKNAASFKRKLAKLSKTELVKWAEHKIKHGEDLITIAKLHDIPVETIMEINQLKDGKVSVGRVLKIPPVPALNARTKKV